MARCGFDAPRRATRGEQLLKVAQQINTILEDNHINELELQLVMKVISDIQLSNTQELKK